MKRRILALLLALTMILPVLPALPVLAETEYSLTVAGTKVTSANKSDVLGNGTFSYDATANRLTVSGNLTYTGIVIESNIKDLEIYVAADSRLENVDPEHNTTAVAIQLRADTTITGPGRLILPHTKDTQPLWVDDDVLTIRDAYVEGGIGSFSNEEAQLNIINSTVRTGEEGSIRNFPGGFTLTNCYISAPDGAYAADDGVKINSYTFATDVVILPGNDPDIHSYDLIVGGVLVTDANKRDILGNGVFRFDPEYNDLKIYGDYSYDKDGMIINEIPSLNIRVEKDATLTCPGVIIEAVA
ncbi:MAG: hypothetical protein J6Z79_07320, partial [Clostridia bacterium]|nr:hypothetical protein [Clostridia bacterium]